MNAPLNTIDLSIIIATHNRADSLMETLGDLCAQEAGDAQFEILVCDNGSTDHTREAVEAFRERAPRPVVYIPVPQKGKSFALNEGIRRAGGSYLFFTDDDTRLEPDWLSILYSVFLETGADGAAGPVHPLWQSPRPQWLSERLLHQIGMVDHGTRPFILKDKTKSFIGPNCAYRKKLYQELGGYAPYDTHEDIEWFLRVFKAGKKLAYEPRAAVRHKIDPSRLTVKYFARRMFKHGKDIARGAWENREAVVAGVPLWTLRLYFEICFQAFWAFLRGDKETALWHWLRKNLYAGAVYYGFQNWLFKAPRRHVPPAVLSGPPLSAGVKL